MPISSFPISVRSSVNLSDINIDTDLDMGANSIIGYPNLNDIQSIKSTNFIINHLNNIYTVSNSRISDIQKTFSIYNSDPLNVNYSASVGASGSYSKNSEITNYNFTKTIKGVYIEATCVKGGSSYASPSGSSYQKFYINDTELLSLNTPSTSQTRRFITEFINPIDISDNNTIKISTYLHNASGGYSYTYSDDINMYLFF